MTNRYLEKIAEKQKEGPHPIGSAIAGTLGAGFASAVVGNAVQGAASMPIMKSMHETPGMDRSTLRKILRDNKDLNTTFSPRKAFGKNEQAYRYSFRGRGPAFFSDDLRKFQAGMMRNAGKDPGFIGDKLHKDYVHMGGTDTFSGKRIKNIDIALHELGHARDFSRLGKLKGVNSGALIASKFMPGNLVGGAMLQSDKTKDYAWTAPLIKAAPTLRSEAAANYHGYNMIKKHGTKAMQNKFLRIAGKNMLGYSGGALASAAVLHGINKLTNKDN